MLQSEGDSYRPSEPARSRSVKQTRAQNVAGSGSISPLGGANWLGKYVTFISAAPASGMLGAAVSRGCSSITVTNPSAATNAATFSVVFKALTGELRLFAD